MTTVPNTTYKNIVKKNEQTTDISSMIVECSVSTECLLNARRYQGSVCFSNTERGNLRAPRQNNLSGPPPLLLIFVITSKTLQHCLMSMPITFLSIFHVFFLPNKENDTWKLSTFQKGQQDASFWNIMIGGKEYQINYHETKLSYCDKFTHTHKHTQLV